ncbi:MAG TPA: PKD domain-containing protein [Flavobacteriales bacterium]|nr:PKD domain-containing protein [Flavobacteriales bacterium]
MNTNEIVRIASDYSVTLFPIAGLPIKPYNSGEISEDGILYLYAGANVDTAFYRVDLGPPSPQLILPNLPLTPTSISDWAISPIDDNLYTIANNTFEVYRFDILGNRTFLGNATGGGVNAGGNFGGIFMDAFGSMYALNNANGNIFQIDQPHTGNTTATLFSQGPGSLSGSDGASNFTLQNAPLITLTNDTSICENTSIQLNASSSSGSIVWQTDPTLSCTSCNDPLASPATPTTYVVTAIANGCTSMDSVSVSFYTTSLLALSSDTSICEGASATLNTDPDLPVTWAPTSGLSCATCTTTLATPTQTTTYIATTDLGACLLIDSVTITVDAITPILLSNDTIVCAGESVQLNAMTNGSDVSWFPADYLSCDDCLDPVCIPLTDISYSVTTPNVACPDTAVMTIAIGLPPELSLTNTPVTCHGTADGTATATVGDGAIPFTYLWSPSGGTDTLATGLSGGSYVFTVTDANGCSSDETVQIDEPTPVAVVAFDTLVCLGTSATLLAQASGGTSGYTYAWSPDGPAVVPDATTSYTVMATDANGCVSQPDTAVVFVPQVPQPVFDPDTNGCAPLCIPFATDAVPDLTYTWDFGDGNTTTGVTPLHCYPDPGSYSVTVTVTDTNGCTNALLSPDLITVRPSPTAAFDPSASVTTLDRSTVLFTDQSTDAQSWFWQFGDADSTTSTIASPEFRFPAVECYTVRLTVTNAEACTDTTSREICIVDAPAVYIPNSFTPDGDGINDSFRVVIAGTRPDEFEITVFDRWGVVLFSSGTPDFSWDGSGTPIGTYPWKLHYKDAEPGGKQLFGHVTLVR